MKINEIERKLENLQALLNEFKKARGNSDDTENLIAEEVHWCIKLFRKLICNALYTKMFQYIDYEYFDDNDSEYELEDYDETEEAKEGEEEERLREMFRNLFSKIRELTQELNDLLQDLFE